jgi:hypothetical protein
MLAYNELGLHAFSHVIDVADGQSRAFSGSEAATKLKQQISFDRRKMLREYEHKIGWVPYYTIRPPR